MVRRHLNYWPHCLFFISKWGTLSEKKIMSRKYIYHLLIESKIGKLITLTSFVHSDEAQQKSSGSMKSRDGIAVEPDKLSEAFMLMIQQTDLINHRKVIDRR